MGSTITTDLKKDKEIKNQIRKAWSLMLKFRQVFNSRDVDRRVKHNIYVSGPLNMLLWGSNTWNLTDTIMKMLNAFHHSVIRWILGIRWEKMKEERITNEEVRERFNNIPPAKDFIGKRILIFLRKTIRTSDNKIQKKMLNAWIPIP